MLLPHLKQYMRMHIYTFLVISHDLINSWGESIDNKMLDDGNLEKINSIDPFKDIFQDEGWLVVKLH